MTNLPSLRRLLLASSCSASPPAAFGSAAWDAAATLVALIVLADVVRSLRRGTLGVDIIALLAIVGALALGETSPPLIALMVAGGNALEEFAEARARRELTH